MDASGQIISQSRYLPFGELLWEDGASPTDYTYTGQRSLSDIGLMDYNARFYDPMLGRFTSPDSIVPDAGSVIGYNRFAYVNNNPMRYTDPSGHGVDGGIGDPGFLEPKPPTYSWDFIKDVTYQNTKTNNCGGYPFDTSCVVTKSQPIEYTYYSIEGEYYGLNSLYNDHHTYTFSDGYYVATQIEDKQVYWTDQILRMALFLPGPVIAGAIGGWVEGVALWKLVAIETAVNTGSSIAESVFVKSNFQVVAKEIRDADRTTVTEGNGVPIITVDVIEYFGKLQTNNQGDETIKLSGKALVIVTNEDSGTSTMIEIPRVYTMELNSILSNIKDE